jgi:hypothetical protein
LFGKTGGWETAPLGISEHYKDDELPTSTPTPRNENNIVPPGDFQTAVDLVKEPSRMCPFLSVPILV